MNIVLKITIWYFIFKGLQFLGSPPVEFSCSDVKTGRFHFGDSAAKTLYIIHRTDSIQTEILASTSDTLVWKIAWKDECTAQLSFVRSNKKMSAIETQFYKSQIVLTEIVDVNEKYYLFKVALNSFNANTRTDTMWIDHPN